MSYRQIISSARFFKMNVFTQRPSTFKHGRIKWITYMWIIWIFWKTIVGRTKCPHGPHVVRVLRVWDPGLHLETFSTTQGLRMRTKAFAFYDVNVICTTNWGYRTGTSLCEPLWSIRLHSQLMTKLEMMHMLQAQACGCISAHPGLPHQRTK